MTGAAIAIDDASATDTILSVKHRVHAANRKLPVRQQRLVYRPGPRGMEPLADDETLGGAGVAQDGSAALDVLLDELTAAEVAELGEKVYFVVPVFSLPACRLELHFSILCSLVFIHIDATSCWLLRNAVTRTS